MTQDSGYDALPSRASAHARSGDDQARRGRPLRLGKGAVLAHRLARLLAAESDEQRPRAAIVEWDHSTSVRVRRHESGTGGRCARRTSRTGRSRRRSGEAATGPQRVPQPVPDPHQEGSAMLSRTTRRSSRAGSTTSGAATSTRASSTSSPRRTSASSTRCTGRCAAATRSASSRWRSARRSPISASARPPT